MSNTTSTPFEAASDERALVRTGLPRKVSLARLQAFSGGAIGTPGWPTLNLHTDQARAEASGLAAPIASGMQAEGYMIALVLEEFGEEWFNGGSWSVKHVGMLSPGDVAIPKLRRAAEGADPDTVDIRCECPDGRLIVFGSASAPVKSRD